MSTARTEVLARLRRALGDPPPNPRPVPREYHRHAPADLDLLAERLRDYRALVRRVDLIAVAAEVRRALAERGARRVVAPVGIPPDWLDGVEVLADDPPLTHTILDGADAVVTGCAVAVALTGTIVLDAGTDQGRRVLSLLPDYHLCVVRADQVVGSVSEAVARLDPTRPQTWISGPSATSDIELNRVEGVHGPRTLEVILTG